MKRLFFFIFSVCLLVGCAEISEDTKTNDAKSVDKSFTTDKSATSAEKRDTSAIWRVKLHSLGSRSNPNSGRIIIALENGRRYNIAYNAYYDGTENLLLVEPGDTIIYRGDDILEILFKK